MQVENSKMIYRGSDELARVYRGDHVIVWEPGEPHDYSSDYLTFKNVGNNQGVFMFHSASGFSQDLDIEISKNNGPWTHYSAATVENRTLSRGDIMSVKGLNSTYTYEYDNGLRHNPSQMWISGDTRYHIFGNIMSLVYGDNFSGQTALDKSIGWTFFSMFARSDSHGADARVNNNCVNAKNLSLPATSLAKACYFHLLYGTYITRPPKLPATELENACYRGMFETCDLLKEAPSLPATVMKLDCYFGMFSMCSSLEKAPQLPAMTLYENCYAEMFQRCSSLVNAPELPALTLARACYNKMFSRCTSLVNPPQLPSLTLVNNCYENMFSGCTSLTKSPDLLASTIDSNGYVGMFDGCTSLNYVKCLATTKDTLYSTKNWLRNVSPTGTFVKDPNTTWSRGVNNVPDDWTIINAT